MGKAIVNEIKWHSNTPRDYYNRAYRALRWYYRVCDDRTISDEYKMQLKYNLWLIHGKYLDIVWRHIFSKSVAMRTGKGTWHGWIKSVRFHQFTEHMDIDDYCHRYRICP